MQAAARKGLMRIAMLMSVAVLLAGTGAVAPTAMEAQEPPVCYLESAVYLGPTNWLCLGGTCGVGYCCLICETLPGGG
jgi:hypothetical protein